MGGFDLYGNYYSSRQEALNAEEAQCARIDARITSEESHENQATIEGLMQEIDYLKQRIQELEKEHTK